MKTAQFLTVLLLTAFLASCSGEAPSATPTPVDIPALQTAAVQTVIANVTQTALAQPTETLAPTETPVPPATETPTPEVTATTQLCDNSAFISDASVTDGTQMVAGQEFVKTWKVKNTGTCTWSTGYRIVFSYGEKMSGLPTPLAAEVAPGAEVEISVNLKAPLKSGNFFANWRLANNNGYPFGEGFTVAISVP